MIIELLTGDSDYVREAIAVGSSRARYGRYHRSKDKKQKASLPFGSYMMNKKWTLDEEFNNHMLRFQQVSNMNDECY